MMNWRLVRIPCSTSYKCSWLSLEALSGEFWGTETWQSHCLQLQRELQAQLRPLSPPSPLQHTHNHSKTTAFLLSSSVLMIKLTRCPLFLEH